jgi:hypothetical protein
MADSIGEGLEGRNPGEVGRQREAVERGCGPGGMADADSEREGEERGIRRRENAEREGVSPDRRPSTTHGHWRDADWLLCRDGKWRPVEPIAQQMVDGITRAVGLLRTNREAAEEVNHVCKQTRLAEQVMRAVWDGNDPQAIWQSLGRCLGLPEATVLLAHLCQQSRELGDFFNSATPGGTQGGGTQLRSMRQQPTENACASQGRERTKQFTWQLGDAMPKLPQTRASSLVSAMRGLSGHPLCHGAPARVGRLRAYGNAIVAQVAAEVIGAYMECRP